MNAQAVSSYSADSKVGEQSGRLSNISGIGKSSMFGITNTLCKEKYLAFAEYHRYKCEKIRIFSALFRDEHNIRGTWNSSASFFSIHSVT